MQSSTAVILFLWNIPHKDIVFEQIRFLAE